MEDAAVQLLKTNPRATLAEAEAEVRRARAQPRPISKHKQRILPSKIAMVDPHESDRRLSLHSPAAHSPDGQMILPGFGVADPPRSPCLPLAWYDLGELPGATNQAAPLALRTIVESCAAVRLGDRDIGVPVVLSVTLREFLAWLYPGRRPSPAEYWPRLMAASEALDSFEARFPFEDPETGRGGLQRIVSLGTIPRGPGALDDMIRIIVDLPPGSGPGPILPASLRRWGVKSAPAYRLLLNLAFDWFEPGRTHAPVGKGERRHWARSYDHTRYPAMGHGMLVERAFPTSANRDRWHLTHRADKALAKLQAAGDVQVVMIDEHRFRVLPPEEQEPGERMTKRMSQQKRRKPPGLVEGEDAKRAAKPERSTTVAELEQLELARWHAEYGV